MGWFHALAAESSDKPSKVFHCCPKSHWNDKGSVYYPKAYDDDKFTHSMHEPHRLMDTMNCFYKGSEEKEWICLEIDRLGLEVAGIEMEMVPAPNDPELKCPHIFGGIPREAVTKVFPVIRGDDGEFLFVQGLTDTCSGGGEH